MEGDKFCQLKVLKIVSSRKPFSGSAIFSESGDLLAAGRATWIASHVNKSYTFYNQPKSRLMQGVVM